MGVKGDITSVVLWLNCGCGTLGSDKHIHLLGERLQLKGQSLSEQIRGEEDPNLSFQVSLSW